MAEDDAVIPVGNETAILSIRCQRVMLRTWLRRTGGAQA
jgi:hypothetical protein